MCLSTVYRGALSPENIIMKNVQTIECRGENVILTDLLDRQMTIRGELTRANLTEGIAFVEEK